MERSEKPWVAKLIQRNAAKAFDIEAGEVFIVVGFARVVGRWWGGRGYLGLSNFRLVYAPDRTLPLHVASFDTARQVDIRLDQIRSARIGSRWHSLGTALWGASTLVLVHDGETVRFSTYGARAWKEKIDALLLCRGASGLSES